MKLRREIQIAGHTHRTQTPTPPPHWKTTTPLRRSSKIKSCGDDTRIGLQGCRGRKGGQRGCEDTCPFSGVPMATSTAIAPPTPNAHSTLAYHPPQKRALSVAQCSTKGTVHAREARGRRLCGRRREEREGETTTAQLSVVPTNGRKPVWVKLLLLRATRALPSTHHAHASQTLGGDHQTLASKGALRDEGSGRHAGMGLRGRVPGST